MQKWNAPTLLKSCFSTYFLKGNDTRLLSPEQQKQFVKFVQLHPKSHSFMIYNSYEATRKLSNWFSLFPWVQPFYAIKSNPSKYLMQDLLRNGACFDCASKSEIQLALSIGAQTQNIIYSNPIKQESDLEWAENNGIPLTVADTLDQLYKLKQIAPKMKILWRITIKEDSHDNISTPFSGKFGDDLDTQEKIRNRMTEIHQLGVNLEGIHFHCGSGQHGSNGFKRAIILARKCIQIGKQVGHSMKILDLGGGYPSGQLPASTIQAINLTKDDPLGYRVIAEPGRHFSAYSFYLMTRIIGKRNKSGQICYHLNESVYHCFNCNIMDDVNFSDNRGQFYNKIDNQTLSQRKIEDMIKAIFFGMTCDGIDVIAKNMWVPKDLEVNDWLCYSGMGAYTYGSKSNFNGMKSTDIIEYWSGELVQKVPQPIEQLVLVSI